MRPRGRQAGNSLTHTRKLTDPSEKNRLLQTFAAHREELKQKRRSMQQPQIVVPRPVMGHTQVAQVIGARGPNTQINAACASGAQGIAMACDWIRTGRCERVLVVSADDVTHKNNLPFIGTGFMAAGAATVEKDPAKAAVPFGATRNGMILGSGASAFVVERDESWLSVVWSRWWIFYRATSPMPHFTRPV